MKNETYEEFVEKFKPKKTTDDCYTQPEVYEVIKDWVCRTYNVDETKIIRPFKPGGGTIWKKSIRKAVWCWTTRRSQSSRKFANGILKMT